MDGQNISAMQIRVVCTRDRSLLDQAVAFPASSVFIEHQTIHPAQTAMHLLVNMINEPKNSLKISSILP